jgi:hypothetical protein
VTGQTTTRALPQSRIPAHTTGGTGSKHFAHHDLRSVTRRWMPVVSVRSLRSRLESWCEYGRRLARSVRDEASRCRSRLPWLDDVGCRGLTGHSGSPSDPAKPGATR